MIKHISIRHNWTQLDGRLSSSRVVPETWCNLSPPLSPHPSTCCGRIDSRSFHLRRPCHAPLPGGLAGVSGSLRPLVPPPLVDVMPQALPIGRESRAGPTESYPDWLPSANRVVAAVHRLRCPLPFPPCRLMAFRGRCRWMDGRMGVDVAP